MRALVNCLECTAVSARDETGATPQPGVALSFAFILFPDFTLILLGTLLYRFVRFGDGFWSGLEMLVYFVLFPSLLFLSTATAKFDLGATATFVALGCSVTVLGFGLGSLARLVDRGDRASFASGVQTAFRFNSYLALAIAGRVGGSPGIALMALLLGTNVPISNAAAVFALARHGGLDVWGAMLRNPLIIATMAGLACNVLGIAVPEFVNSTLSRLGAASIALGLIAVGAGLRGSSTRTPRPLVAWWLAVKLIALPAFALVASRLLKLEDSQRVTLVMFAALPTASSAYILAIRMGGDGPLVAFLISAGTLVSIATLPIWLVLAR
jgi:malonate transporter